MSDMPCHSLHVARMMRYVAASACVSTLVLSPSILYLVNEHSHERRFGRALVMNSWNVNFESNACENAFMILLHTMLECVRAPENSLLS